VDLAFHDEYYIKNNQNIPSKSTESTKEGAVVTSQLPANANRVIAVQNQKQECNAPSGLEHDDLPNVNGELTRVV